MIERIHLEILLAIETHNTLTEAAKTLHLTQSALSHAIKKIETYYNVKIWHKKGRCIQLNQTGQQLLKMAKQLLPQFEQVEANLALIAEGKQGFLRLGMECYPCYQWLIQISHHFIKKFPQVDLDIKQKFQFGGIEALLNNNIDLLITPDPIPRKELLTHPTFNYELVAVTGKEHPLTQIKHLLPHHLTQETLFTYPIPKERLDIYTEFLIPANKFPKKHKGMESTELMLQLVENHRGITILPEWLVKNYQKEMALHTLKLGKSGIHKSISLVIREADKGIPYIQSFLELAKNHKTFTF